MASGDVFDDPQAMTDIARIFRRGMERMANCGPECTLPHPKPTASKQAS